MRSSVSALALLVVGATCLSAASAQAASPRVTGASEFDAPSGLAFGGGHLWVTNQAGDSVTEINPSNGAWVTTFTRSNGYRFSQPAAITNDGANLFVANGGNSVTEMRASNGQLIRVISGAKYRFVDPVAIDTSGNTVLVLNAGRPSAFAGSITEINARTGALVRTLSGAPFAFGDPVALTVSGPDAFVADERSNSMTEVNIATGRVVRVVTQQGLASPDGIGVEDGQVWVADSATNAATDIDAATGKVVVTENDSTGDYGFWQPSMVIGAAGSVYIATPFGTSPMVTNVTATTGAANWYMCNTNGPYYFSLLSAFAVSGDDLWVASRSGANSQTPAAATGSLTEMQLGTGNLIATYPAPSTSVTTTTSTTTTTTPS
jgi:streptogramin lyase